MQCDWCEKVLSNRGNWTHHIQSVHLGVTHKCYVCSAEFSRMYTLNDHIRIKHRKQWDEHRGPFTCHVCSEIFSQSVKLESHINVGHKKQLEKSFGPQANFEKPQQQEPQPQPQIQLAQLPADQSNTIYIIEIPPASPVDETLTCKRCLKQFSTTSSLRRHMESVHLGIRHKCSVCTATFSRKGSMINHMRNVHNVNIVRSTDFD